MADEPLIRNPQDAAALSQWAENNPNAEGRATVIRALEQWETDRSNMTGQRDRQAPATANQPEGPLKEGETLASGAAEMGVALGENALQLASGALAEPIAGWAGLLAMVPGGRTPMEAYSAVSENLTYDARTERGQKNMEAIAGPLVMLEKGADAVATQLSMGNPWAATSIKTAILGAPELFGLRGLTGQGVRGQVRRQRQTTLEQYRQLKDVADAHGLDLTSLNIREHVAQAIREKSPSKMGEGMDDLRATLQQLDDVERAHVNHLYNEARATPARVKAKNFEEFYPDMLDSLADYGVHTRDGVDFSGMPKLSDRLSELEALTLDSAGRRSPGRNISIEELENIRRRAGENRPPKRDRAQNAALTRLQKQIDGFLDHQFHKDMISGEPAAVQKWKDARSASNRYRTNFSDNKAIVQLMQEGASIRDMHNWIFGASAVNGKTGSLQVIRQLKTILGDDSPQLNALRQDILFDVAEPIILGRGTDQGLGAFIVNYDKLTRKGHREILSELGINVERDLRPLRDFADAARKVSPEGTVSIPRLTSIMSRFMFGHAIAKQGMKVALANSLMDMAVQSGRSGQSHILHEIMKEANGGGLTNKSLILDPYSVAAGSVIAAYAEEELNSVPAINIEE